MRHATYDEALLLEKLEQINEALARIKRRFAGIGSPDDFPGSDCGLDIDELLPYTVDMRTIQGVCCRTDG